MFSLYLVVSFTSLTDAYEQYDRVDLKRRGTFETKQEAIEKLDAELSRALEIYNENYKYEHIGDTATIEVSSELNAELVLKVSSEFEYSIYKWYIFEEGKK